MSASVPTPTTGTAVSVWENTEPSAVVVCPSLSVRVSLSEGILNEDGSINNGPSIRRLAEVAVAYAKAGRIEN